MHVTKTEADGKTWKWVCSCGKIGTGYASEDRAKNGARIHRLYPEGTK